VPYAADAALLEADVCVWRVVRVLAVMGRFRERIQPPAHRCRNPEAAALSNPVLAVPMAIQPHGCELVRGRIGHHPQPPEGLRDRAAGGSEGLALRYMEWSQYDGPISPDGSALLADTAEVLRFHIGHHSGG
jgi:hypothetical protein